MGKLGIYARQSIEKETTGSIDDQILEGEKQAKLLNFTFEIYVDRGITAAKATLNNRPEFLRLIKDIQRGEITALFVIDQTRLSRNQASQLYIKTILSEYKVKVYTKLDGIIDYEDSDSEFMSDIRTLFASKLVKDTSKKIKGVLLNNAIAGKVGGGPNIPWGFTKDKNKMLVQNPEEILIYRRMVEMSLMGIGSGKIAETLNIEGIKTRGAKELKNGIKIKNKYTGKQTHISSSELDWAPNTVISILKNSLYCGKRNYKGQIIPIEPVISAELWDKLQSNLTKNKTYSGGTKVHFYLLKGLLRCERCGRNLYGYVKEKEEKRQRVYMCSSKREKKFCGMRSINIDRLERLVWRTVKGSSLLFDKVIQEFNSEGNNSKLQDIENRINKNNAALLLVEKKKDGIIDLYSEGRINLQKFDSKSESLKAEQQALIITKDALEREKSFFTAYSDLKVTSFKIEQLFERLTSLTPKEKSQLLTLIVNDIKIDFDEVLLKHKIKIILNPNSTVIQKEIPIKGKDRMVLDYDLLVPVMDDEDRLNKDFDDTGVIVIDGKAVWFSEQNGKLIPDKGVEAIEPESNVRKKKQIDKTPPLVTKEHR